MSAKDNKDVFEGLYHHEWREILSTSKEMIQNSEETGKFPQDVRDAINYILDAISKIEDCGHSINLAHMMGNILLLLTEDLVKPVLGENISV